VFLLQSDEQQETMPLSSFYMRKRPARQILFSPPHYLSKTASPGLVCMFAVEEHCGRDTGETVSFLVQERVCDLLLLQMHGCV